MALVSGVAAHVAMMREAAAAARRHEERRRQLEEEAAMRRCIAGIRALQKHWRRHRAVFVFAFPTVPPPYVATAPPKSPVKGADFEGDSNRGLVDGTTASFQAAPGSSASFEAEAEADAEAASSASSSSRGSAGHAVAFSGASAPGPRRRSRHPRDPFRPTLDDTPLEELHQQRLREIEAERKQRLRNIALRKQFSEQEAMVRKAEEQAVLRQRAEEEVRRHETERRRVERLRVRAALVKARETAHEAEKAEAERRELQDRERKAETCRREQEATDARERKLRMQVLAKDRQRDAQRKLVQMADAYRCRVNLQWRASLGCVKAKVRIKLRLKSKAARQGRIRQAKEEAVPQDTSDTSHPSSAPESSLKARLSNAVGWARRQMSPSPSLMEKVGFSNDLQSPAELEAFPDDFEDEMLDDEMIFTKNPL